VAPQLEVETDHSVPVAQGYDGDVAGDIVFGLDDLLVRNFSVGAVSQGDVVRHLLFDGDLRSAHHGGVAGQALGVDFDAAFPE